MASWLIDCNWFSSRVNIFTRIGRLSYYCRWRDAKYKLLLSAIAFEQEGIFNVPYLLWHRTFVFPTSLNSCFPWPLKVTEDLFLPGSFVPNMVKIGSVLSKFLDNDFHYFVNLILWINLSQSCKFALGQVWLKLKFNRVWSCILGNIIIKPSNKRTLLYRWTYSKYR